MWALTLSSWLVTRFASVIQGLASLQVVALLKYYPTALKPGRRLFWLLQSETAGMYVVTNSADPIPLMSCRHALTLKADAIGDYCDNSGF